MNERQYGVPRCPADGGWCNTCRIGGGNGDGGRCARLDPGYVAVAVSRELLAELGDWSQPVQARIEETPGVGTGWEMTFRRAPEPACPHPMEHGEMRIEADTPESGDRPRPDISLTWNEPI